MSIDIAIDIVLASGAMILAWLSLSVRDVFTAIVLYVGLGLLAAIIWVRLSAWDVAIAEAAIGAGLTGALLLVAWKKLRARSLDEPTETTANTEKSQHVS